MNGDFTRDTFDAAKHFSRVLMQQGRVQLDADWNEQTAILLRYLRILTADILGPGAGPADAMGFDLITKGPNADARIDAIEPDPARADVLKKKVADGDVVIGTGRYYVHGVLVENHRAILYTEQPGYPFSEETTLDNLQNKALLAYLDVWERHITYVQDDHIREVALGGPDTCSRAQVVWQLKALLRPDNAEQFDCTSLEGLLARELPHLRARARLDKPPTELCVIAPDSRYRGAENQLYRVEVHQGGVAAAGATGATFKWSRDNGSVVFPIVSLSGTTVVVESLGRDDCLSLKPGDWVEVSDDDIAMAEQAGPLAQVDTVDRDELTVTLKLPAGVTALPAYAATDAPSKHPSAAPLGPRRRSGGLRRRTADYRSAGAGPGLDRTRRRRADLVRPKRPIQGRGLLADSGARGHRRCRMAARTRQQWRAQARYRRQPRPGGTAAPRAAALLRAAVPRAGRTGPGPGLPLRDQAGSAMSPCGGGECVARDSNRGRLLDRGTCRDAYPGGKPAKRTAVLAAVPASFGRWA